ncbi:hypothetical protein CapIbe_001075 [Capra ibex]
MPAPRNCAKFSAKWETAVLKGRPAATHFILLLKRNFTLRSGQGSWEQTCLLLNPALAGASHFPIAAPGTKHLHLYALNLIYAGDWSPPLRRQRQECHSFHSSHGSCSREPQLKMHSDSANSGKAEDTSLDAK